MVNRKKSLTKKIVTLITTLSFISYGTPLFPLKNINSLLDTNEIIANAGDSGGGSYNGSTSSGSGPQCSISSHYGLRFYAVNVDGELIRRYYYEYNYGGKTRYLTVYESDTKSQAYATDWAKYDMKTRESQKKAELKTSLENFFNDTANQKTVDGNIMYDLNAVLDVVDHEPDTVNGKVFTFNKEGIKNKIKELQTKEEEGVTYISRVSNIDSIYVTGNIDGITVKQVSGQTQGKVLIQDIVDEVYDTSNYLDEYQNLLRIGNQNHYADSVSVLADQKWSNTPVSDISSYLPRAGRAKGEELQKWIYDPIEVNGETVKREADIYNYILCPRDGSDNYNCWNQATHFYDGKPKPDTGGTYNSFRLIVEPLVDIPIRSSNDSSYAGRYYGGWYGYMTTLESYYPGSNGGSYTQASIKSGIGQGFRLKPIQSDIIEDGDIVLGGITYYATGYSNLPSKADYTYLHDYNSRGLTGVEVGWGMHVYFTEGNPGGEPPQDPINTYAVDKDDNPNDDNYIPSKPDRPETSRIVDSSGNIIGDGKHIDTVDKSKYSEIETNSTGDFQIIKLYVNAYKTTDRIDYDSDTYNKQVSSVRIEYVDENGNRQPLLDTDGNEQYDYSYVLCNWLGEACHEDGSAIAPYEDPIMITAATDAIMNNYYTKIEQVTAENSDIEIDKFSYSDGQFYMTNTSRDVFITDEYTQTAIAPDVNGFKLAAWHVSEYTERNEDGSLAVTPLTVPDWLSLDTTQTDGKGGYKLDFHFNHTAFGEGDVSESEFHYSPDEDSHLYSRLYEDQSIYGAASYGFNANADGSLTIDDQEQKTIYLLYLRELESITTDTAVDTPREGVPSRTWTPGGSGRPTGDNTGTRGPKSSETPTGSGTPAFPEHKFHVVKIYGTTNPYTFETADDYVSYQDLATYNVRISDEYGVDGSQYHLRAYTVSNTSPLGMDYLKSHVGEVLPADTLTGTGVYTASQWADGWTRGKNTDDKSDDFDYKNTDNINAGQYAHHGFIDGYDGWSGNDETPGVNGSLVPTTKAVGVLTPEEANAHVINFVDLMKSHFTTGTVSDRYCINWNGGGLSTLSTTKNQGIYVYPTPGYDKTIYFGDYVDKSSEGTLYLLYLKEDSVVYRSDPLVIPESYITRAFDLNENSITLSGDATALYRSYVGGGGSDDTTGEATHSLMEHRFIFTTEDNII